MAVQRWSGHCSPPTLSMSYCLRSSQSFLAEGKRFFLRTGKQSPSHWSRPSKPAQARKSAGMFANSQPFDSSVAGCRTYHDNSQILTIQSRGTIIVPIMVPLSQALGPMFGCVSESCFSHWPGRASQSSAVCYAFATLLCQTHFRKLSQPHNAHRPDRPRVRQRGKIRPGNTCFPSGWAWAISRCAGTDTPLRGEQVQGIW